MTIVVDFDAALTCTSFADHMHKAKTPRQKAILDTVVAHSKGEVEADLDAVMPTLNDNPRYHEYGVFANTHDDTGPKGMEAVKRTYEAMVANGSYVIESKKDRVVVSDDETVTSGTFRQILSAKVATEMGFVGEDAEGFYMLSARTCPPTTRRTFWMHRDPQRRGAPRRGGEPHRHRGDFYNTDGIRRSLEVIAKARRDTYHWTTNHVVEFGSPDAATGRSDAFAICTHHDGRISYVAATYDDEYTRRNGEWRFAKRHVTRWFVSEPLDIELLPPF